MISLSCIQLPKIGQKISFSTNKLQHVTTKFVTADKQKSPKCKAAGEISCMPVNNTYMGGGSVKLVPSTP